MFNCGVLVFEKTLKYTVTWCDGFVLVWCGKCAMNAASNFVGGIWKCPLMISILTGMPDFGYVSPLIGHFGVL